MTWWKIEVKGRPDYEVATTVVERDFLTAMAELAMADAGEPSAVTVTEMPGSRPSLSSPTCRPGIDVTLRLREDAHGCNVLLTGPGARVLEAQ